MINQRCIYATQGVGPLLAVRKLPCNNVLPFRCSPAYTTAVTADTLNTGKNTSACIMFAMVIVFVPFI